MICKFIEITDLVNIYFTLFFVSDVYNTFTSAAFVVFHVHIYSCNGGKYLQNKQ